MSLNNQFRGVGNTPRDHWAARVSLQDCKMFSDQGIADSTNEMSDLFLLLRAKGLHIEQFNINPMDHEKYVSPDTFQPVIGRMNFEVNLTVNAEHMPQSIEDLRQTFIKAAKADKERKLREEHPELMELYKAYESTLMLMGEQ